MNYLGLGVVGRAGAKLVSSCKDLYNDLNGANLTGAVDVIAIRQPDGSILATPFHVRFGKWGVFRTGDLRKEVEVEVNGQPVDDKMMIIESGSAFFAKPKGDSISTLCSNTEESLDVLTTPTKQREESNHESLDKGREKRTLSLDISSNTLPVDIKRSSSTYEFYTPLSEEGGDWKFPLSTSLPDSGVLSDGAIDNTQFISSDSTAHSDSELEPFTTSTISTNTAGTVMTQGNVTRSLSTAEEGRYTGTVINEGRDSLWGKLTGILRARKKRRRYSNIEDGVYLDDLFDGHIDENDIQKFFPNHSLQPTTVQTSTLEHSDTSGLGSSPSLSPSHLHTTSAAVHYSSSEEEGDQDSNNNIDKVINTLSDISISKCGGLSQGHISEEMFTNYQISFEEFCTHPELLVHPDIVVKIRDKYYGWQVAAPIIMSCLLYSQPLPQVTVNNLLKSKKSRFWSFWNRNNSLETTEDPSPPPSVPIIDTSIPEGSEPWNGGVPDSLSSSDEGLLSDEEIGEGETVNRNRQRSLRRKRFTFTNELTSDELLKWPLHKGRNELVFSITTKYQGTARAYCSLYLWDYTVKLVISDLDGTITRSDVAGQVLPLIGKDWTHNGVIELFSAISRNGYQLVYLSARAIGQSWYTKNFLKSTRRGECYLPDGPLLVTPFSLYTAFKKEVIEKIPDEFKTSCLQQIRSIFPSNYYPFHSGFGNRDTDVKSYHQVNIPTSRIFTVNHKGEIKNRQSLTFQTSYNNLMDLVDAQFPNQSVKEEKRDHDKQQPLLSEDYTSFMFWQQSFNNYSNVDLPPL